MESVHLSAFPETIPLVIPSKEYKKTVVRTPDLVPAGVKGFMHWIAGRVRHSAFNTENLRKEAHDIYAAAEQLRTLSDEELHERLMVFKEHFRRRGREYQRHIPASMALLVESAERLLGLRPYPEQVMGALALMNGTLIEMQTGEGKTLVAALAALFFGWSGRPCHVITVNDYLAERDYAKLEPFYKFCGVSVACVLGGLNRDERRTNYACAVVYVTAKELVADFLKDRLLMPGITDPSRLYIRSQSERGGNNRPVLNGLSAAVVDEADSVLVDDAATPLIISRPVKNGPLLDACMEAVRIAALLQKDEHYVVDERFKQIMFTKVGTVKIEQMLPSLPSFWHSSSRRDELLLLVLAAREFFKRGKDYVVKEGKVVIIDEFTGRLMPDRKWRQGTQQIVEMLEGVEMTDPVEVAARISFQRFFRFFETLCGMTGTVKGVTSELWHIYGLNCVQIPTHRPPQRQTRRQRVFSEKGVKYAAVLHEIEELHRQGRPVLVGTRSVRESEFLADLLKSRMLSFQLLNALYHSEEAAIIARAGERGNITIATNMAGRGTDIMLGDGVSELGGLHVILTEPNEAERIDRQFYGRCARQGDPGSVRGYVSLDDVLIQRFFPGSLLPELLVEALYRRLPGAEALVIVMVKVAQMTAQNLAYQQRLALLRQDDQVDKMMSFAGAGPKF
jgi:preprotein translocase subunit SecA